MALPPLVFIVFVILLVSAWSNAVNLTDGLDGLAAGSMAMVSAAYVLITFWQYRNACATARAWAATTCVTRWIWH